MADTTPRDPVLITEQVLRAIAPTVPSETDREVSAKLWEAARRNGPRTGRSLYDGTMLRHGEPEQIVNECIGSPKNPVCVRAPGGRWTCSACGAQTMVSGTVGPRVTPCTCAGDVRCVHPVPLPRRAFPRARKAR